MPVLSAASERTEEVAHTIVARSCSGGQGADCNTGRAEVRVIAFSCSRGRRGARITARIPPGGRQMRNPLIPFGAAVLLFLSVLAIPLVGRPQNGLGNGGDPRPRRSGRPAPRSGDGRALLGGPAGEKG